MSRSIHVTYKNVKGLSKKELDDQSADPNSDLRQLGLKSELKKSVKKGRKEK
jgi:hypothetical protein